jgi:hypothetical protein
MGKRDSDVTLVCERLSHWRSERLEKFSSAFPKGEYYGAGWPNGFLPEEQCVLLYQRTKIGVNFHNSTGPINFRTYALPANGVMQLCDNKSHLGQIFELNREVVGFDTVEEAIERCHYFLEHDDERRQIAVAGWERALKDYNEVAVFRLMTGYVAQLRQPAQKQHRDVISYLHSRRRCMILHRSVYHLCNLGKSALRTLRYLLAGIHRYWWCIKGETHVL